MSGGFAGSYGERHGRAFGGWLVLFAVGYVVLHHAGTIFTGLGEVGDTKTRWADWIDLLTPYVVTGTVGGALRGGGASRCDRPARHTRRWRAPPSTARSSARSK